MGSNPHRYSDPETSRALKRAPPLPNPREKINFPKAGLHHLFWAELYGRFSPLPATCCASPREDSLALRNDPWGLKSQTGRDSTTELRVLTPMSQPPGGGSCPRHPWKDPSEALSHSRTCFLWPLTWEKEPIEKEFFNLNSGLAVLRLIVEITQKTNTILENAFCFVFFFKKGIHNNLCS